MWRVGLNATSEYDKDGVVSVESCCIFAELSVSGGQKSMPCENKPYRNLVPTFHIPISLTSSLCNNTECTCK